MAISHEVSSEIATALFAAKAGSPAELNELKRIVFQIYSTLEESIQEARKARHTSARAVSAGATMPAKRQLD